MNKTKYLELYITGPFLLEKERDDECFRLRSKRGKENLYSSDRFDLFSESLDFPKDIFLQ